MYLKFPLFCLTFLVAGCATVSEAPVPSAAREAAPQRLPVEPQAPQGAHEEPARAPERPRHPATPTAPASPAVQALMREAASSRSRGELDKASSSLERAIRIQPRNAQLWNEMAEVRLEQNQAAVAENLAKKSVVLAKGNRSLIQRNWGLIARARRAKGDSAGAAEAEARAGH